MDGPLDDLLKHKMFHRAKKIPVDDKFLKSKKKKTKETEEADGDAGSKSDAATALAKGTYLQWTFLEMTFLFCILLKKDIDSNN